MNVRDGQGEEGGAEGAGEDVAMCCRFSLCWAHFARGGDEWRAGEAGQWEAGAIGVVWHTGGYMARVRRPLKACHVPSFPLISRHDFARVWHGVRLGADWAWREAEGAIVVGGMRAYTLNMPDIFDAAMRSAVMRKVGRENTAPEMIVRRALHGMGYRYSLHRRDLPGRPDIVLPKYKTVIFVHGCFWHGHPGCARADRPTSRTEYWNWRLDRNIARDRRNVADLEGAGWRVVVVWECEAKNRAAARRLLEGLLPARTAAVQPTSAAVAGSAD